MDNKDLTSAISDVVQGAVTAIADAAEEASKTVAHNAEEIARVLASQKQEESDHDAIIRVSEKVDSLETDIKDLKDDTTKRIDNLKIV